MRISPAGSTFRVELVQGAHLPNKHGRDAVHYLWWEDNAEDEIIDGSPVLLHVEGTGVHGAMEFYLTEDGLRA